MSRKSLSGKKKTESWIFCEKCCAHLTYKDWEYHIKKCKNSENIESEKKVIHKLSHPFIENNILYTNELEIKKQTKDLIDIPSHQLNKLVFICESTIRLCNFAIGDEVAIRLRNNPELVFVRNIWPINDQFLSTVFVSEEDFNSYWISLKGEQLLVEKLPNDPEPAEKVTFQLENDTSYDLSLKSNLKIFLQVFLRWRTFHEKSYVICNFFNKNIRLNILNFKSNAEVDENNLELQFSHLNVNDKSNCRFFKIHNETQIVFEETENLKPEKLSRRNTVSKDDIGGLNDVLKTVEEAVNLGLGFEKTLPGMEISRGLLLFGPTGCGKSLVCEAIASCIEAEICKINSSEIFSKFYGETEKNLKKYFDKAFKNYPKSTLIIIEDLNNLCPKQENNEIAKRVSVSFLNILDSLHMKAEAKKVFVLATTSDIDSLNPSVRRCGRFDCELEVGVPSAKDRFEIIRKHLKKVDHSLTEEQIKEISDITHGFVGSDLSNLVSKAGLHTIKSSRKYIEIDDLLFALNQVKPSAMREVSIENPNVKWEDIGGQEDLKLKLKQAIEWPLLYPEKFEKFGIKPPRGILMFGPPGCSKTMIAKALATESRLNFLSIKGPELFSMWVGESERAVREIFRKAKQVAPAIIFFDEIDAIGGERSSESGSSVKERVLAQILTELDGVTALKNVTIVAATNRPDMIDKALMRPGRIDRIIYVGLPDSDTRREIFKIKLKNMPIANDVGIEKLIEETNGYSGAEIQAICQEAALKALEDNLNSNEVCWKDFEHSLKLVKPRTSQELLKLYENYLKQS